MNELNEALVTRFYTAFKNSDARGMAECYADDVHFSDPVFPTLKGVMAKQMWAMLCQNKANPENRRFGNIRSDGDLVTVEWEAIYAFPLNGRPIHNRIKSNFTIKNNLQLKVIK